MPPRLRTYPIKLMERDIRIELMTEVWKTPVLPLN